MTNREIRAMLVAARKGTGRRHPAEVTSDRLGDATARWHNKFTGAELDMIATIRRRLEQIAESER